MFLLTDLIYTHVVDDNNPACQSIEQDASALIAEEKGGECYYKKAGFCSNNMKLQAPK